MHSKTARRLAATLFASSLPWLVGCGGVEPFPSDPADAADAALEGAVDASPRPDGALEAGADAKLDAPRDGSPIEPLPDAALPDVTPALDACPPPPEPKRPCDTLRQTGCAAGEACIDSPQDGGSGGPACAAQVWGTSCAPAGSGTQWADCGAAECAAGYECMGLRGAFVCVRICDPKVGGCPTGLACDWLYLGALTGICQ